MKLLLISNSTNAGEEYLRYPLPEIGRFLDGVREAVFVPYAAVTFSYAEYEEGAGALRRTRHPRPLGPPGQRPRRADPHGRSRLRGRRQHLRPGQKMQQQGLMKAILRKIKAGTPLRRMVRRQQCLLSDDLHHQRYAHRGARIVRGHRGREVQINPHYLDANPAGHAGETREQRFWSTSRPIRAAGWPDCAKGCMLRLENGNWS